MVLARRQVHPQVVVSVPVPAVLRLVVSAPAPAVLRLVVSVVHLAVLRLVDSVVRPAVLRLAGSAVRLADSLRSRVTPSRAWHRGRKFRGGLEMKPPALRWLPAGPQDYQLRRRERPGETGRGLSFGRSGNEAARFRLGSGRLYLKQRN